MDYYSPYISSTNDCDCNIPKFYAVIFYGPIDTFILFSLLIEWSELN